MTLTLAKRHIQPLFAFNATVINARDSGGAKRAQLYKNSRIFAELLSLFKGKSEAYPFVNPPCRRSPPPPRGSAQFGGHQCSRSRCEELAGRNRLFFFNSSGMIPATKSANKICRESPPISSYSCANRTFPKNAYRTVTFLALFEGYFRVLGGLK